MSRLLALSGETVRVQDRNRRSYGFTITAFDPAAGLYLGLAHASADVKVGDLPIPTKAREPTFGEGLIFYWGSNVPIYPHPLLGSIIFCNDYGVCGRLKRAPKQGLLWTAKAQKGPAYIITNVCVDIQDLDSETTPAIAVPIEITALENKGCGNWGKPSFTFTGPRFKGMSGSPIIQDGRIVGALRGVNADGTGVGLHIDQMLDGLYKGVVQVKRKVKIKGKHKRLHDTSVKGAAELESQWGREFRFGSNYKHRAKRGYLYAQALNKVAPRYQALQTQVAAYETGHISEGRLFEKQRRTYLESLKLLWDYELTRWRLALKSWESSPIWSAELTREQRIAIERCVSFET